MRRGTVAVPEGLCHLYQIRIPMIAVKLDLTRTGGDTPIRVGQSVHRDAWQAQQQESHALCAALSPMTCSIRLPRSRSRRKDLP
jgi:hypothetical protein